MKKGFILAALLFGGGGIYAGVPAGEGDTQPTDPPEGETEARDVEADPDPAVASDYESEAARAEDERQRRLDILETENTQIGGVAIQLYQVPKDSRMLHLINPRAPEAYFPQDRRTEPPPQPWAFTDPREGERPGIRLLSIDF